MKTIKSIMFAAMTMIAAASFADATSTYLLLWQASVEGKQTVDGQTPVYATIGVKDSKGDFLCYINGNNGNMAVDTLVSTESGYASSSSKLSGYISGSSTDVASYTYYLALLDSNYAEIGNILSTPYTYAQLGDSIVAYTSTSGTVNGSAATFTATIPEPTSGLLMLLGLACVGLRRKVK